MAFIGRSGNVINFRVSDPATVNSVGHVCTLEAGDIEVKSSSLAGALTNDAPDKKIEVSWVGRRPATGQSFDASTSPPLSLGIVVDQFRTDVVSTAGFNGVVDVNSPSLRTDFLTDDAGVFATNEDSATVTATDRRGLAPLLTITGPYAVLDSIVTTINGDFSYADTNGNGSCTESIANFINSSDGTAALATNCQSLTVTDTSLASGNNAYVVTFRKNVDATGAGTKIRAAQEFDGSVKYKYHLDSNVAVTEEDLDLINGNDGNQNGDLGGWTLNGFSAFVSYMPFGDAISQIVYLTNKSTLDGEVTVEGYNDQGQKCEADKFSAGSVPKGSVKSLSTALANGVAACYGTTFTGKVSFNVVANFPAALGELYSAYNVAGNRITVINTSNGRVTAGGNSTTGGGL